MRRLPIPAVLLSAIALLGAVPPAGAADAHPWWQLLTGARPTHMAPAPDQSEIQEVTTSTIDIKPIANDLLVAPISVGGEEVACLGTGKFVGLGIPFFGSPAAVCEKQTGFAAADTVETPAELAVLLEGIYGTQVQLAGPEGSGEAPAGFGEGAFTLITVGRWVPDRLEFGPPVVVANPFPEPDPPTFTFGGKASSQIVSEGSGRLTITLTNLGNAPMDATSAPLQITDELPDGFDAYGVVTEAGAQATAGPVECALLASDLVDCSYEGVLPPYEAIEIEVLVALTGPAGKAGKVSVSGGDADPVEEEQVVTVSEEPVPFGFEYFQMRAEDDEGEEVTRAGSHPFQLTTTVVANSGPQSGAGRNNAVIDQPAIPRNLRFTLPAGLVGSATAAPECELADFLHRFEDTLHNACPDASAIGVASVTVNERGPLGLLRVAVPVFNLPPARGEPARFGIMVVGVPSIIDTSIDPDSYRITAEVRNVPQVIEFISATTTIWGTPGAEAHDGSRGWKCVYHVVEAKKIPGECEPPAERHDTPFLRLPTQCREALSFAAGFEPWNVPAGSLIDTAVSEAPEALRGCNQIPFDPRVSATPTSHLAQNPSGLDFELRLPNSWPGQANATPEAQPERVEVILPEGVTINPSQAEGLATCSPGQYAAERYDSGPGEGCPQASKIGSLEASSPLIEEKLEGSVYVATPYENPFDSLIALYIVARSPERGVLVRQPLEVKPDPRTGQLITLAEDLPPLPYDRFSFHFREGGRSPLVTPPGCGTFHTKARFVPWSAADPDNPAPDEVVERTASFTIERGVDGGPCPSGSAPFSPGFEAGTLNNQAGAYSPFLMRLTRQDGEQDMGKFSFTLPPGVVPKLAGVPYCPEEGIARARSRTGPHGGQEELADPSCPAASQIGRTVAGAGVGNQLTYVEGKLYLAGPYNGNPISAVAITPAVAGPFDAGTVVVREGLRLNPVTHRGEVDGERSDPIPHILKGIPLNLRDLRVYADRPEFTLNATSCDPFEASSTIWGEGTALEPLGATPATLSSRYQAAGCAGLGFKPRLDLRLKGGAKRGDFPGLHATYKPKPGHANLSRLALTFPKSEFVEQGHFRTICTRVQFNAGQGFGSQCPKGSIYGQAEAWSPLLDQPLRGPVYLRSSDHNLPDAVLALHGLVDIEVAVRIDSVNGRLRAIVQDVPDAPVSKAIVRMQGGQKGLFVNSRDLCVKAKGDRARVDASGQNAKRSLSKPAMRALGCAKKRR